MPTVYVSYNQTEKKVLTKLTNTATSGYAAIGSFEHPDATYPDSYVIFHGVQELLYHRSAADASKEGFWPDNITDLQNVEITIQGSIPLAVIKPTPTSLALSVASDGTNGKNVTFEPSPIGSSLGTLSIKTAPTAARATATISGNILNVKPVATGAATKVVVTNGDVDVTINITVSD